MLKKTWTVGLTASLLLLSGCTTAIVESHSSVKELETRWDALESQYGPPNTAYRLLFADSLKEIIYEQGEAAKAKIK